MEAIVMMKKEKTLDWEMVRRKLEDTLSAAEEKELETWKKGDPRRKKLVDSARSYYEREELPCVGEPEIDQAWQRFRHTRDKVAKYRRLGWWSSAAIVLITLGTSVWLSFHQQSIKEPGALAISFLPMQSKVTLVLSDGQILDLKEVKQQQFTDQQANIHLDSNGIRYEVVAGEPLALPHTIRIPQGGEFQLSLSDGTRVWLNSKTELTYPLAFSGTERRVKLSGEAYFEVAHNEKQPFVVETDGIEVKVLGTSFNINVYPDEQNMVTTLVNGRVCLQDNGQVLKTLTPSEQAIWNRAEEDLTVRKVNTSTFIQWRNGKFVFRDNTLDEIMRTLARWYDMEYEFEQPELKAEKFYGVLDKYEEVQQLLEQFEKTGKVHFIYNQHKIHIKK